MGDRVDIKNANEMQAINGDTYCFDGVFYDIKDDAAPATFCATSKLYEVVRIIDHIPLFFEAHYERLQHSAEGIHAPLPLTMDMLKSNLLAVVAKNGLGNCNCMIVCYFQEDTFHSLIFARKHAYPSISQYQEGVDLTLLAIERQDPQIKQIDETYNQLTAQAKAKPGIFEVLLVNHDGWVTEASKANVFFIFGDQILTPPATQVLVGVTRQKVIKAIVATGTAFTEKNVSKDDLERCDGVFITGTSLHVLPVNRIGALEFSTANNPIFLKIKKEFEDSVENYLEKGDAN
ncbi:MAG: aminotransferase class IV [Clostridia bacterium]